MFTRFAVLIFLVALVLAPPAGAASIDQAEADAILERVALLRRLEPLSEVRVEALERATVVAHLREDAQTEEAVREAADEAKLLRVLGQIDGEAGLVEDQVEVLGARVQGVYRPETAAVTVVADAPSLDGRTKVTMAHELTHALQDQHFNLAALTTHEVRNSDRDLAIRALVEGDASVTAQIFATLSLSADEVGQWTGRGDEMESVGEGAPAGISLGGPNLYDIGSGFAQSLLSYGGWDAVNDAYRQPPQSSEQVLHPGKYLAGEAPNLPLLGDSEASLGQDWRLLREDTLGELGIHQVLGRFLPVFRATPAAAGWGGDRYQLLEESAGGGLALVLVTNWDSRDDAGEFFVSYADSVSARYGARAQLTEQAPGQLLWSTPENVIVLRGSQSRVVVTIAPTQEQARALAAGY